MFRPFMKVPASIAAETDTDTTPREAGHAHILRLPDHVLDLIFDELDVLDRCTMALTCRRLVGFACRNEHLDYLISQPPTVYRLEQFFRRLARGWIPTDALRYCSDCGKFIPTDAHHWRHVSEKYTRESVGRIPEIWRLRREDGWLRYWIERWCSLPDDDQRNSTAAALKHADTTELVCPRCAVVSPATNEWRMGRIAARNERHATTRAKRIVSPGMNSPYVGVNASGIGNSPDMRERSSPLLERRHMYGTGVAVRGAVAAATAAAAATGLGIQST